jgi:ADP-heptose:LPS heptosyltransferase
VNLQAAKLVDRWLGAFVLRLLRPWRVGRDLLGDSRELPAVREIAVVKFWGVGNAALLLPLLEGLKRRYPAARLTVVTFEANRAVLSGAADRLLTVRPEHIVSDFFRALALLRRSPVDIAIDFEQYARASQILLFLSGARQVIAFDMPGQHRAHLADVRVPYDNKRHAAEGFLELARAAGVAERRYRAGGLVPAPETVARVDAWIARHGIGDRPLVVLHPGSGDNFPGRRWPTRRFGLVARRLVDECGAAVAVTGLRGERRLARQVVEASERDLHHLAGSLSLDELIALISRAELLVSNDTGPVHLASALSVPVVGLYGPNTPRLYGPLSPLSTAFYDAPACSPCITNLNYKTSRCRNPVCIRAIDWEAVGNAAVGVLQVRRPAERRA